MTGFHATGVLTGQRQLGKAVRADTRRHHYDQVIVATSQRNDSWLAVSCSGCGWDVGWSSSRSAAPHSPRPGLSAGRLVPDDCGSCKGPTRLPRGSEAALLLGAYFPQLVHAVIVGSPSSAIHGAVSLTRPVPPTDPAWTLDGKPLPIVTGTVSNPAAIIPVQKIRGPVLLLAGAQDQLAPTLAYVQEIMVKLDGYHDRYPHQDLVFPDAGHLVGAAFPYDVFPVTISTPVATLHLGGTPFANSVAETSAWRDVLTFLNHLN